MRLLAEHPVRPREARAAAADVGTPDAARALILGTVHGGMQRGAAGVTVAPRVRLQGMSSRAQTPRPARLAERTSLVLLAVGVLAYGAAFTGMRRLESGAPVGDPNAHVLFTGIAAHARYARWAQGGLALVALGLAVAVGASVWTMRSRRVA